LIILFLIRASIQKDLSLHLPLGHSVSVALPMSLLFLQLPCGCSSYEHSVPATRLMIILFLARASIQKDLSLQLSSGHSVPATRLVIILLLFP
jgi:hypothetical protein